MLITNLISLKLLQSLPYHKKWQSNILFTPLINPGVSWVDALNGSVRPVLAYSFFAMYGGVKYVQYKSLKSSALLVEYLDILWSIEDQTIFVEIISFYFGQHTFSKLWKCKT
ncbi:hypothetical protein [Rickettsia conorii]|uniref:hypothetical protein n=1 Tax=Rickettsia conorii TaxID=781 RepID=UPI0012EC1131|nr:hypothetical protein [Rickettsia conorii]